MSDEEPEKLEVYLVCYVKMLAKTIRGIFPPDKIALFESYLPPRSCLGCPFHTECMEAIARRSDMQE